MKSVDKTRSRRSAWYLLFLIVFAMVLWPPIYNRIEPTVLGIPFFYWYQMLCVLVSAVITALIYLRTRE